MALFNQVSVRTISCALLFSMNSRTAASLFNPAIDLMLRVVTRISFGLVSLVLSSEVRLLSEVKLVSIIVLSFWSVSVPLNSVS